MMVMMIVTDNSGADSCGGSGCKMIGLSMRMMIIIVIGGNDDDVDVTTTNESPWGDQSSTSLPYGLY